MKTPTIPCLVFAALVTGSTAHADLVPALDSGPVLVSSGPFAGSFAYNYSATVSAGERLDATATNNISNCTNPGSGTTDPQCYPFFTIYDISGFEDASTTATGWQVVTQLNGVTPNAFGTGFDSTSLMNATFYYTASTVVHGPVTIPGFQIVSTGSLTRTGYFGSQSTVDVGASSGGTEQALGAASVPDAAVTAVPEPAAITLLGTVLLGICCIGRRRLTNGSRS